jgi:lysophospholipase L1-like esterase
MMMFSKKIFQKLCIGRWSFIAFFLTTMCATAQEAIRIIPADHHYIQYYGRFDHTNPKAPRFWAPGSYVVARFSGSDCEIFVNDQASEGSHNYIEVKVDNVEPVRIQLRARANRIQIAKDLPGGDHTVTITKNTDASVGYMEMVGFICNSLLPPPPVPTRKIEFIGDDLTAGTGSDNRYMPCDSAEWYDQSSAYAAYGPVTGRHLSAQWQITAATGIGIGKAVGEPPVNMPTAFDKINIHKNSTPWDFKRFQPDVVVVCLGANDAGDSASLVNGYSGFVKNLRTRYPSSQIVCMVVQHGDDKSRKLVNYIPSVVSVAKRAGDQRVHHLIIDGIYNKGCNGLPSADEHLEISIQLTALLKRLMAW